MADDFSARAAAPVGVLMVAAFMTFFDRGQLAPMLTVVADDLAVPPDAVAASLTAYVVAYAAGQLGWTIASGRIGRIRVLAISTALGAIGNVVAAVAPDPVTLAIGRGVAGLAFGATVPAVLIVFGDTMPMRARAVAAANLAAALSLGMTAGTAAGAVGAALGQWRVVFAVAAAIALVTAVLLVRVPEPPARAAPRLLPSLGRIARNPWALAILALTVLEGALLIGVINYLPVSLESEGEGVLLAGLAVALFGIAVIAWSRLVRWMVPRVPAWATIAIGGAATVAAFALLVVSVSVPTVAVATVLLGLGWASAHTQLQTWMTDAVVDARPVGMALFATALFGGGALGTALGTASVSNEAFGTLFAVSAGIALVFGVGASLGRARYVEREN